MNKRFLILCMMISLVLIAACGKKERPAEAEEAVSDDTAEVIVLSADYVPDTPDFVPELSRIKSICELSTMKCIYHMLPTVPSMPVRGFRTWEKRAAVLCRNMTAKWR